MLTHTHRPHHHRAGPGLLLLPLLLLFGLLGLGAPAHADNAFSNGSPDPDVSWAVQPGGANGGADRTQFVYTLRPGTVLRDYVTVINIGRKPLKLNLYTVDAFNVPEDGAFALRNPEEPKTGVGGWIRLGRQSRISLAPGKGMRIPFEVDVPENAQPGDHAGAIVAANTKLEKTKEKGDLTFDVRRRVGARIYLRVEGPLDPALSASQFDVDAKAPLIPHVTGDGHVAVDWSVTNTGNVRLDPDTTIELIGPMGGVVDQVTLEVPEILPGGVITGTSEFDTLPPYGKLSARMNVTAEKTADTVSRTIWSVPWLPILILVLLIVALWLRRRRRRGRWPFASKAPEPVVSDPDPEPVAVS